MLSPKRYKIISCEILFREICFCASQSKNIVDISFLPKKLHDLGSQKMSDRLQEELNNVDATKYDAILLGYGLCNNGIIGLKSSLPFVIPRAHDCIALLLGSKDRYKEYHAKNASTFFKSTGWIERDENPNETDNSITSQLGMNKTYLEYTEQYGEENAKYLMEMMGDWLKNYDKYTYIDTNIGDFTLYKELTEQEAIEKNWSYEELTGSTTLLMKLLNGEWAKEAFLIIPPNKTIKPTYNDEIIQIDESENSIT